MISLKERATRREFIKGLAKKTAAFAALTPLASLLPGCDRPEDQIQPPTRTPTPKTEGLSVLETLQKIGEVVRKSAEDTAEFYGELREQNLQNRTPTPSGLGKVMTKTARESPQAPTIAKGDESGQKVDIQATIEASVKETVTALSEKKVERESTPTPLEAPLKAGWVEFTSTRLPYKIRMKSNWTQSSDVYSGGDVFNNFKIEPVIEKYYSNKVSAGVTIGKAPKNEWVTLENLMQEKINEIKGRENKILKQDETVVGGKKAARIIYQTSGGVMLLGNSTDYVMMSEKGYYQEDVLFIRDNNEVWTISYIAINGISPENRDIFYEMLDSFRFLDGSVDDTLHSPSETPKPTPELQKTPTPKTEVVEKRLSPEELFKALLATPFEDSELPEGFTQKGSIFASNPDTTSQAFDAIGQANIPIAEDLSELQGQPNAAIVYIVFPNSSDAKGAFSTIKAQATKILQDDFDSPAVFIIMDVFFGLTKVNLCIVPINNVLVSGLVTIPSSTGLGGLGDIVTKNKTIVLTKAAVAHLERIKGELPTPEKPTPETRAALSSAPTETPKTPIISLPTIVPTAEKTPDMLTAATNVVRDYYSLLNNKDFATAYRLREKI